MGCNCNNKNVSQSSSYDVCFESSDKCLTKNNYLSEFKTEKEKELVRENIGIKDSDIINITSDDESVSITKIKSKDEDGNNVVTFDLSVKSSNNNEGGNNNGNDNEGGNNTGSGNDNGNQNPQIPNETKHKYNIVVIDNTNFDTYFRYHDVIYNLPNGSINSGSSEYSLMLDDEHDGYYVTEDAARMIYQNVKHDNSDGHTPNGRVHKIIPKQGSKLAENGAQILIMGYVPFGSETIDPSDTKYQRFDMSYDVFALASFRYDGDWNYKTWRNATTTTNKTGGVPVNENTGTENTLYEGFGPIINETDHSYPFEHRFFEPINPTTVIANTNNNLQGTVGPRNVFAKVSSTSDYSFHIAKGKHPSSQEFLLYNDKWYFI